MGLVFPRNGMFFLLSFFIETKKEMQMIIARLVLKRMKSHLDPLVTHWAFESFITTCIIINTILLAAEHHEQPDWLTKTITIGSHVSNLQTLNYSLEVDSSLI